MRRRRREDALAHYVLMLATVAMLVPLAAIVAFLIYKASPLLSLNFVLQPPVNGMREGGVWPALLGTIYLVVTSLAIATPVGVLAAVYLNEYAQENWFTPSGARRLVADPRPEPPARKPTLAQRM